MTENVINEIIGRCVGNEGTVENKRMSDVNLKVLIVEDESEIRELFKIYFDVSICYFRR